MSNRTLKKSFFTGVQRLHTFLRSMFDQRVSLAFWTDCLTKNLFHIVTHLYTDAPFQQCFLDKWTKWRRVFRATVCLSVTAPVQVSRCPGVPRKTLNPKTAVNSEASRLQSASECLCEPVKDGCTVCSTSETAVICSIQTLVCLGHILPFIQ